MEYLCFNAGALRFIKYLNVSTETICHSIDYSTIQASMSAVSTVCQKLVLDSAFNTEVVMLVVAVCLCMFQLVIVLKNLDSFHIFNCIEQ